MPALENRRIRVMLVDDHDMVRKGLGVFIRTYPDLELVGEAVNGGQAVELCARFQPDVILMDMIMPGMDGVQATAAIRRAHPAVQIIALTSFKDEELVRSALEAGAIGYLLKDTGVDELAGAIRAASKGVPVLAPEATKALIKAATQPREPLVHLTTREKEVLALLVQGLTNAQIAEQLVIGPATVKTHVANLITKLGAANRMEAATIAIKSGLVEN